MTTGVNARKLHGIFVLLLTIAVSLLFLRMIQSFIVAILLGAIFAGIAYPVFTRLSTKFGGRKNLAAVVTVVLGMLCVVVPTMIFLGLVATAAVDVSKTVIPWVEEQAKHPDDLSGWIGKIPFAEHLAPYKSQILAGAGEFAHGAATYTADGVAGLTRGTAEFFLLVFIMLYAKFQFLLGGAALPEKILRAIPLSAEDKHRTLKTFTSVTRATLRGAVVIGGIQGSLMGIAFAVAGIHGALFWAVIAAVLSIIPGIGAALVWVPAVIYLLVEGRIGAAVGLGLWCFLTVTAVDDLLRPRLVGKGARLPDLLVLLGTLGGLIFFGPIGIILGPVVAALFVTMWDLNASMMEDELVPSAVEAPAELLE